MPGIRYREFSFYYTMNPLSNRKRKHYRNINKAAKMDIKEYWRQHGKVQRGD